VITIKKILGWVLLLINVAMLVVNVGFALLYGIQVSFIVPLGMWVYFTIMTLIGAIHWIRGKSWGNPKQEVQDAMAKTGKKE
jgi:hypothetical protein